MHKWQQTQESYENIAQYSFRYKNGNIIAIALVSGFRDKTLIMVFQSKEKLRSDEIQKLHQYIT